MRNNQKVDGFTLIELLAVIATISILVAILLPTISKIRMSAKMTNTVTTMRGIGTAIQLYTQDHKGKLPGPSTWAIFPWYRSPIPDTEQAHLFNYIFPYMDLPKTPPMRTLSDALACPALSEEAQKDFRTANYVRRNGFGSDEDKPWGGNTNAEAGKPFLTLQYARQSPNQPPYMSQLNDKALNTAILCTADQQVWVSGDNGLLPETGAFDGKRLFLFLDASISEPTTETNYVRN